MKNSPSFWSKFELLGKLGFLSFISAILLLFYTAFSMTAYFSRVEEANKIDLMATGIIITPTEVISNFVITDDRMSPPLVKVCQTTMKLNEKDISTTKCYVK